MSWPSRDIIGLSQKARTFTRLKLSVTSVARATGQNRSARKQHVLPHKTLPQSPTVPQGRISDRRVSDLPRETASTQGDPSPSLSAPQAADAASSGGGSQRGRGAL